MAQTTNPLSQYFRQPAIYIRLPSQGEFWPEGALDPPEGGEFPVLPMTAIDEITYRTPDALYNGQAVASVIQSCLPNIKNAWHMPLIDVDTILVAIRIASFGHSIEVNTTCPNCSNEDAYTADLRNMLDGLNAGNYVQSLKINDLELFFRPLSYKQITDNSLKQFEDQKVLNILPDAELPENEKIRLLNEAILKLTSLTIETVAQSIALIRTQTGMVNEFDHIREFLQNVDSKTFSAIKDHLTNLRASSSLPPLDIRCQACQHHYKQAVALDQSFFFGAAS